MSRLDDLNRDPAALAGLIDAVPATPMNHRGIAIHHRPGVADHRDCSANFYCDCRRCGAVVVLCTAEPSDVRALLRRRWYCDSCLGADRG